MWTFNIYCKMGGEGLVGGGRGRQRVRRECVRLLNTMMLENHTPSVWAFFFFLPLCHTLTHVHGHKAFLSWWQWEGRAETHSREGHRDTEKQKWVDWQSWHETLFTPCLFFHGHGMFCFSQYWPIGIFMCKVVQRTFFALIGNDTDL